MNLGKELQDKLSEHDPTDVDELILDDLFTDVKRFSETNKKDLEKYNNLIHLSLNGFGLESLDNFPSIPCLQVLELRNNKLSGDDLSVIVKLYPELYKLKLGENQNITLDHLKALKDSSIKKIELEGTAAAGEKDYSSKLFDLIQNLDIVDNKTKEGDDVSSTIYDEEDEDGEFDDEEDEYDEEGEYEDGEFEDDEDLDEGDDEE